MTIHREGFKTIAIIALLLGTINLVSFWALRFQMLWLSVLILFISIAFLSFIISFFRVPNRKLTVDEGSIVAPADGKVVVIEEMFDEEYFKEKRLQISIFMSPLNVHVNRNGISGEVTYNKYHPGKYLVAWHPKSSTENERHSVVIRKGNVEVLFKQIAGALARRIVNYLEVGQQVRQSEEYGFIKFGSRVDILLPAGTKVKVAIGEKVKGGVTAIASF